MIIDDWLTYQLTEGKLREGRVCHRINKVEPLLPSGI
jgi:hypothetical protein